MAPNREEGDEATENHKTVERTSERGVETGFRPAIDSHVHVMPQRLLDTIQTYFDVQEGWEVSHPTIRSDIEETLSTAGVSAYFGLPYVHKPGIADDLNTWVLEQAEDSDMLLPFATAHGDDDVHDVVQRAFDGGARGLKFQCPVQQSGPDDPRLEPAFELAASYDRPVIFHAGTAPLYHESPHVGSERFETFLDSFPDVRVCAAHLGADEIDRFLELACEHDQVYLDTAMAVSPRSVEFGFPDPDTVSTASLEAQADSIMYGSDFPLLPTSYEAERVGLLERQLSATAQRAIFFETAMDFVGEVPA